MPGGAFSSHLAAGEIAMIGAGDSTFSFIHVDDAAQATVAALMAPAGLYNVVDSQPVRPVEWLPAYADWIGCSLPPGLDEEKARGQMGVESVYYQNSLTGADNRKAREILGLDPRQLPWLKG